MPSSLRDIACKAVDDERPRTTRLCKKCEDRESDVVKNSDGRMVRRWQEYYLFVVMACRAMMMMMMFVCLVWFHYPSAAKNEDINEDITLPFAILESTLIII